MGRQSKGKAEEARAKATQPAYQKAVELAEFIGRGENVRHPPMGRTPRGKGEESWQTANAGASTPKRRICARLTFTYGVSATTVLWLKTGNRI